MNSMVLIRIPKISNGLFQERKNYQLLLERIACCDKEHTNFEPTNSYYRRLKSELVKYREIEPMLKDQKLHCDTFPLKRTILLGY